jgi:hypothetical protein
MPMTNDERLESYKKKYGDYLIGKEGNYVCNRCKNVWEPNDTDVNRKAMMCYYRLCGACRLYLYNREIARKSKIN